MIHNWSEIKNFGWNALLTGNGFSIGVSEKFRYESLLRQVDELNIPMYPHARSLFDEGKVGTANFEEVLRVIYHAHLVNFYNQDAIKQLYTNVQRSLIDAVRASHVSYSEVPHERVANALEGYSEIYTTNYDLIPYWSLMEASFAGFCDYFWAGNCEFDLSNVDLWGSKTPIYYLHGAIHLKITPNGTVYKVRANDEKSLSDIVGANGMGEIPLFISEGKSEIKLRKIRENYYLGFCYENFLNCSEDIVVFGHGLDKEYDEHILNALKNAPLKKIAISVFSGMRSEDKEAFTSNIKASFVDSGKELLFFESDTHPLSLR
jgi:hypothetical protein